MNLINFNYQLQIYFLVTEVLCDGMQQQEAVISNCLLIRNNERMNHLNRKTKEASSLNEHYNVTPNNPFSL